MQIITGKAHQTTETIYRMFCLKEILSSRRLQSYRKRTGGNKVAERDVIRTGRARRGGPRGADASELAHTDPGGSGPCWGWASVEPLRINL